MKVIEVAQMRWCHQRFPTRGEDGAGTGVVARATASDGVVRMGDRAAGAAQPRRLRAWPVRWLLGVVDEIITGNPCCECDDDDALRPPPDRRPA